MRARWPGFLLTAAIVAACGSSQPSSQSVSSHQGQWCAVQYKSTAPAPPPPSPAPANFPVGTYTVTLTADQVGDNILLIGKSTLSFKSDGTGSLSPAGDTPFPIQFFVSGSCITIVETGDSRCGTSGSGAGYPAYARGEYTWSARGSTLTLSGVYDGCGNGGRLRNLTLAPWTSSGSG